MTSNTPNWSREEIKNWLDWLLSVIHDSNDFQKKIIERFWAPVQKALNQALEFWEVDKIWFQALSKITPQDFEDFFQKLDFTAAMQELEMSIPPSFIELAAWEYRACVIDCLTRYKIYEALESWNIESEYDLTASWDSYVVYKSKTEGIHTLQLDWEIYAEINLRDDYYTKLDSYLFFTGGLKTVILNLETGELAEIDGEHLETYIIWWKTYLLSVYPDSNQPTDFYIYCLEEEVNYHNQIKNFAWNMYWLFERDGEPYVIETSYLEFNWYHKWEKREKWRLQILLRNFHTKEIISEQPWVLRQLLKTNKGITICTIYTDTSISKDGKVASNEVFNLSYYPKDTQNNSDPKREINIISRNVVQVLQTESDVIVISQNWKNTNTQETYYTIQSMVSWEIYWETESELKISSFKIKEKSITWMIIECKCNDGKIFVIKSADYFPELYLWSHSETIH